MSRESVWRKFECGAVERTGIHLCYSQSWPAEQRVKAVARLAQGGEMIARRGRRNQVETAGSMKAVLVGAALCAPLVWAGHALLQWKHL